MSYSPKTHNDFGVLHIGSIGNSLGSIWYPEPQNPLPKRRHRDFPGGPVVKKPPSNAGDAGSIPGRGTKIPHAAGQLSP